MAQGSENYDSDYDNASEEGACGITQPPEVHAEPSCSNEQNFTYDEEQRKNLGQILVTELPPGMTAEKMRSVCLRVADPISITFLQDGKSCLVSFSSIREAKAAERDINRRSPYYMSATLATADIEYEKDELGRPSTSFGDNRRPATGSNNEAPPENLLNNDDGGVGDAVVRRRPLQRVRPYFEYNNKYSNPSLTMRQMIKDFRTRRECVALGRGYVDFSDTVPTVGGRVLFSRPTASYRRVGGLIPTDLPNNQRVILENDNMGSKLSTSASCSASSSSATFGPAPNPSRQQSSVLDLFHPNETGWADIFTPAMDNRVPCLITLDRYVVASNRLHNYMKFRAIPLSANLYDKVLIHKKGGDLARAVVLEKSDSSYRVALIDVGETVLARYVYEMPEELTNIMSFAGFLTYLGDDILSLSTVKFRVKERRQFGTWLCEIVDSPGDEPLQIIMEEWFPPTALTYIPLGSGIHVVISYYEDLRTVYVRRIEPEWESKFVSFNNDVSAFTLTAKSYKKPPKHGEVCSARYARDGCYYRGFVQSVGATSAKIYFMDYGNTHETNVDDLFYLPMAAKLYPCFAVRVELSGVMEFSSLEAVEYMNKLVGYEIELVLTYDPENPNEVILTEAVSGNVVNEVIARLATPAWERDRNIINNPGCTLEAIDEIHYRTGTFEDIVILSLDTGLFLRDGTFWSTLNRADYLGHLNGELKQIMTEYCTSQETSFCPRNGELCIAKVGDQWYRCVSMVNKNVICQLFLLDFGVIVWVETRNIRKFHVSFAEIPALAVQCGIAEYGRYDEWQRRLLVEHMNSIRETVVLDVMVSGYENGIYYMTLPFAERFLPPRPPNAEDRLADEDGEPDFVPE